jgi:5-methylcytosine-specific restriction endonuclease McrA
VTHLAEFALDAVLPFVVDEVEWRESPELRRVEPRRDYTVAGRVYSVKLGSVRYRLFKQNRACVACGLEGTRLILDAPADEKAAHAAHFNLYAEEDGVLVLMTKDHIRPKSLSGPGTLENMRTMCAPCNGARANEDLTLEQIRERRVPPSRRHPPLKVTLASQLASIVLPTAPAKVVVPVAPARTVAGTAWALVRAAYDVTSALTVGDIKRAHQAALDTSELALEIAETLEADEPLLDDTGYKPRRWGAP